jgi:hypothetical protein
MATKATEFDLQPILDRLDGVEAIARQDYLSLANCLLCDFRMTDDQRRQIARVFDLVQLGRIRIVHH